MAGHRCPSSRRAWSDAGPSGAMAGGDRIRQQNSRPLIRSSEAHASCQQCMHAPFAPGCRRGGHSVRLLAPDLVAKHATEARCVGRVRGADQIARLPGTFQRIGSGVSISLWQSLHTTGPPTYWHERCDRHTVRLRLRCGQCASRALIRGAETVHDASHDAADKRAPCVGMAIALLVCVLAAPEPQLESWVDLARDR